MSAHKMSNTAKIHHCFSADRPMTTIALAETTGISRANVSSILNDLCRQGVLEKRAGKPVTYQLITPAPQKLGHGDTGTNPSTTPNPNPAPTAPTALALNLTPQGGALDSWIGSEGSFKNCIQQAKAAMLYPPLGLPTLIVGPSGSGKSYFAEHMYRFALEQGILEPSAPFIPFNCADYANNPELLLSKLYGSKKGAFTGALQDREGLVAKADGGVLFLDEIHRLPPQGQEMLFHLIDNNTYYPMGSDDPKTVQVRLIAATTENPRSALLLTFTRRMPMVIVLPSLDERPKVERMAFIESFLRVESARIGRDIWVSPESMKNLLLYPVTGNVGQLKSDLKIACAAGFLKCLTTQKQQIDLDVSDFPKHINHGILYYKKFADVLAPILEKRKRFVFSHHGAMELAQSLVETEAPPDIYEEIEKRIEELKAREMDDKDIHLIMNVEMDHYFRRYLDKWSKSLSAVELSSMCPQPLIEAVESFLKTCGTMLNRVFPQRIFYGLCLHLSATLERLKHNKTVVNHKIQDIMTHAPEAYGLALVFCQQLESLFHVAIPADEVGFVALFIVSEGFDQEDAQAMPTVVIAMHGFGVATSMADFVEHMTAGGNVLGFDMPFDQPTDQAYHALKDLVIGADRGAGVLLLVDMGSLVYYGELIQQETGIVIRSIDMVTTLIALECARKATLEKDIHRIADAINTLNAERMAHLPQKSPQTTGFFKTFKSHVGKVLVTICTTGEGSALMLKQMIEDHLTLDHQKVQVIPLAITNREDLYRKLEKLGQHREIIALVGAIDPQIINIPFIPISSLFIDRDFRALQTIIESACINQDPIASPQDSQALLSKVIQALSKELTSFNFKHYETAISSFLVNLGKSPHFHLTTNNAIALTMHIACAVDRKLGDEAPKVFKQIDRVKKTHMEALSLLKTFLLGVEKAFSVEFDTNDLCFILRTLKEID